MAGLAASKPMFSVQLNENDVPGAKFRSTNVNEHSMIELKRWLEYRGLQTSGNKQQLIERYVNNNLFIMHHT